MRKSAQSTALFGGGEFTVIADAPEHKRVANLANLYSNNEYGKDAKAALVTHSADGVFAEKGHGKDKRSPHLTSRAAHPSLAQGKRLHGVQSLMAKFNQPNEEPTPTPPSKSESPPKNKLDVKKVVQPEETEQVVETLPTNGNTTEESSTAHLSEEQDTFATQFVENVCHDAVVEACTPSPTKMNEDDHHDEDDDAVAMESMPQEQTMSDQFAEHLQDPAAKYAVEISFAEHFAEILWEDAKNEALQIEEMDELEDQSMMDKVMSHVIKDTHLGIKEKEFRRLDHTADERLQNLKETEANDAHHRRMETLAQRSKLHHKEKDITNRRLAEANKAAEAEEKKGIGKKHHDLTAGRHEREMAEVKHKKDITNAQNAKKEKTHVFGELRGG